MLTAAACRFDEDAAELACDFFSRYLKHTIGEWHGRPFILEPWQRDIVRQVFGWKRPDGSRRYRTVYIEVPRKNGKSTFAAGLALKLLFGDRERGAQVYGLAADGDQAAIVFDEAKRMRDASPKLEAISQAYKKSITWPNKASFYRVMSSAPHTKHGFNPHGVIFDELHTQKNRDLWDVFRTAAGARRQPLTVACTTAGYDRHSLCWEIHDYAVKVRDGVVEDPEFLPVIYAAAPEDDWTDPAVWAKANPGFGVTIKPEFLERECREAREMPAKENVFKRLYLNIWTEQATRWLPLDKWDQGAAPIDRAALRGRRCFAGFDLAATRDTTAFVLVFLDDDGGVTLLPQFWIPGEGLADRSRRDGVNYEQWIRTGVLKATAGNVTDYDVIRADINALGEEFDIAEIAIDRWNSAQLQTQLMGDGFTVVPFGQGFGSMSAPAQEFERLVIGGRVRHGGHPVLKEHARNAAVLQDAAGNIKPAKDKSTGRIDGIVAAVMGVGRAKVNAGPARSIYETMRLKDLVA
ncbi:MAG: terminase large subunit [Vicinamibacterales bacterium]